MEAYASGQKAKLRWRCRRGMRELDEAMRAYLDYHYENAVPKEKELFHTMLDMQDPELYRLISGKDKDAQYAPIINAITATLKTIAG